MTLIYRNVFFLNYTHCISKCDYPFIDGKKILRYTTEGRIKKSELSKLLGKNGGKKQ